MTSILPRYIPNFEPEDMESLGKVIGGLFSATKGLADSLFESAIAQILIDKLIDVSAINDPHNPVLYYPQRGQSHHH